MSNDSIKDRLYKQFTYIYKYAINFQEISYIRYVQTANFKTYCLSICNEDGLVEEYRLCINNKSIPYAENINNLKCSNLLTDIQNCQIMKNELEKVFYIRQRKYINDKFFK